MSRPNYPVPLNPEYNPQIPMILNDDFVEASTSINPRIIQLISNIHAVKQQTDDNTLKINSLSTLHISGIVNTYSDLLAVSPIPPDGTLYLVRIDENNNGRTTVYEVIDSAWEFLSFFEINLDNYATLDALNIAIENALTSLEPLISTRASQESVDVLLGRIPAGGIGNSVQRGLAVISVAAGALWSTTISPVNPLSSYVNFPTSVSATAEFNTNRHTTYAFLAANNILQISPGWATSAPGSALSSPMTVIWEVISNAPPTAQTLYAQLDSDNEVCGISQLSGKVDTPNMIEITEDEYCKGQELLGCLYEADNVSNNKTSSKANRFIPLEKLITIEDGIVKAIEKHRADRPVPHNRSSAIKVNRFTDVAEGYRYENGMFLLPKSDIEVKMDKILAALELGAIKLNTPEGRS